MTNAYKILVRKPEGKRPPGRRTKHTWENTRLKLRGMRWEVEV
jgi:hypothetical protein